jgi:hypothetical protein
MDRHLEGATPSTCVASAELKSANPAWGGHNMFVTPQRDMWVQIVEPSQGKLLDRRFRARLSEAQVAELRRVVDESGFLKLKDAERPEVRNEVVWRAAVTTCDGRTHAVRQFGRDAEAGFQALVAWFQRTAAGGVDGAPLYEGAPDYAWSPPAEKKKHGRK